LQGLAVDTHIYICGPTGFMDYIKIQAIECGYSSNQIHTEYFNSNLEKNGASFKVHAKKSGLSIDVLENQTIAQALHTIGIKIELSCEQGVCGTCLTPVLEGVPEHRDSYQTDEEKEKNLFITPCCSRALTDSLVLNI
jgi:ferredoxin